MKRITGWTYPVREALKRLGARWNAERRAWEIEDERAPLAEFIVEHQLMGSVRVVDLQDGDPKKIRLVDFTRPVWCQCEAQLPEEARTPFKFAGGRRWTHTCGRSFAVVPHTARPARRQAEVRYCWECGCAFTYRECCERGGDWADSYCGC